MHFGFFYIIVAPIGFDQEAEAEVDTRHEPKTMLKNWDQEAEVEAVVDTRQLWIWEADSPKSSVKCQNF